MKEKELKILNAAIVHFEKDGYHAAKISDIAKTANVGKGTVYEYFTSKQDLFDQMVMFILKSSSEMTQVQLNLLPDPIEKLKMIIDLDWTITKEHWNLMNVIISRMSEMSDTLQCELVKAREHNLATIELILQEGIDQGIFIKHDTRILALMLKGSFNQSNMDIKLTAIRDQVDLTDAMYHENTDHIFNIFINNILKP